MRVALIARLAMAGASLVWEPRAWRRGSGYGSDGDGAIGASTPAFSDMEVTSVST